MKKYELFKSVLLFLLVTISGILTWNLWTYQPAYNEIENAEYIQQDITISPKRDLEDQIRPVKVLYHDEEQHYGSTSEEHITKWMTEMKKWSFYNFRNVSNSIPKQQFLSFVHEKDSVEIIYPDEIPIQTFELMFQVDEKSLPSIYFDHIVLKRNKGQTVNAYFIDYDHRRIYESSIKNLTREDLERINQGVKKEYHSYFRHNISEVRTLFLPKEEIEINRIQYYTRKIETEKFRDALFSDPSYVKKNSSLSYSGDFYTDGSQILKVDSSINVMDYVNPAAGSNDGTMDSHILLKRSFSFVNDHGGWTDAYRFASWNREKQEVVYRLYEDNYPVFNSQGMTEVLQRWGNNEIMLYRRPIYFFIKLPLDSYPVKLPPGDEIIKRIEEQQPEFNPSLLKDVVVGYELIQEDKESKVVSLEPAWYYLYDQKWTKVEKKAIGGKWSGLE